MRILMISDVYFPRINGVSTSIKSFRDELIAQGHEVILIAPEYPADNKIQYVDDINIMRIKSQQVILDPEDRFMSKKHILNRLHYLKYKQFDVLHIHTPFVAHYAGLKLAKALNIPCVESYHTYFEEYLYQYIPFLPKSWLKGLARKVSRSQCNSVDAVVVPSNAMQEALNGYGVICEKSIIPTGLNINDFKPGNAAEFRREYDIPETQPLLVHIGRVAHEKNIDFLLLMLDLLRYSVPDILLVITGEGPSLSHLQARVKKLKLEKHVRFIGYLSREKELMACYKAGDVFVFSSHTETQGLVLLEAMACGTPVVSLAKMGTVDILKPEKGAIISDDDPQDFAVKVSLVLLNTTMRERMSQEAKEYAATWSTQKMTNKMLTFYQRTVLSHVNKSTLSNKGCVEINQEAS
ncbi:MAG: glycosyltransferase [Gammaproteobacteria bacterium]|nr:glycosyltransferase [Gammaproteobacteria bacterium]MCW8987762.1 glycosyltransferase [Gammaproteobacteria bacterium]